MSDHQSGDDVWPVRVPNSALAGGALATTPRIVRRQSPRSSLTGQSTQIPFRYQHGPFAATRPPREKCTVRSSKDTTNERNTI
jgi:hypothetical protein